MNKPTLYSYCIPYDDGAAPNPFWGKCTLAICKPVIRRTAEVENWIIGTGSKNSPAGDKHFHVVYVMKVTEKMTMKEYDEYCKKYLPNKIPDISNEDTRKHLGDCIYDYSSGSIPKQRKGVHNKENMETDLGGKNVLLSDHFFYFGDNPIELRSDLIKIIKNGQGHKSKSNDPYVDEFLKWLNSLNLQKNKLYGKPQIPLDLRKDMDKCGKCAETRKKIHELDEEEHKKGIC